MKRLLEVEEILGILRTSVGRLEGLATGLTDEQLDAPLEPGEWSAAEILGHLRACDDVLGGNIRRIVTEDRPAWRRRSPREWLGKPEYAAPFSGALEAFAQGRRSVLSVVEPLTGEQWSRVAIVTVSPGKVLEQSTRFFGDWLAGHEQVHLEHLERLVTGSRTG